MRKIKKLLFFTSIFISSIGYGQISGIDHLLPAKEFNDAKVNTNEYYGKVLKMLHYKFKDPSKIRYTVFPSFSAEYSFSLEAGNTIILHTLSENYWYSKRRDEIKVICKEIEIDKKLARQLIQLFTTALKQKKEYVPKRTEITLIGFDGVNYYFSADIKGKTSTGKTWSPRTENLTELISICEEIKCLKEDKIQGLKLRIKKLNKKMK